MPEETRVFIRSCIFAAVVATAYWFLSHDPIGTVLLAGFGVASFSLVFTLRRGRSRGAADTRAREAGIGARIADLVGTSERPGEDRPFEDERGRIPTGSIAPFLIGVAVAMAALGLIFGPWSVAAAVIPFLLGVREWLREVSAEIRALAEDEEQAASAERA